MSVPSDYGCNAVHERRAGGAGGAAAAVQGGVQHWVTTHKRDYQPHQPAQDLARYQQFNLTKRLLYSISSQYFILSIARQKISGNNDSNNNSLFVLHTSLFWSCKKCLQCFLKCKVILHSVPCCLRSGRLDCNGYTAGRLQGCGERGRGRGRDRGRGSNDRPGPELKKLLNVPSILSFTAFVPCFTCLCVNSILIPCFLG